METTPETCAHNKIRAREVRKRVHIGINLKHNHNQAPAMVAPTQPQYFHLGMKVQVGHTYSAQLVVEMIIRKDFNRIISAPGVNKITCYTPEQNKGRNIWHIVVAQTTPQVTAPEAQ